MRALIGLGNPGKEYEATRHNVGFDLVDAVAGVLNVQFTKWKDSLVGEAFVGGQKVLLVKPQTFMNRSGVAVKQLVSYYDGLAIADLAVAYDDVYVAPGVVRIRQSGGSGGHNGVKSLLEHLDPDVFWRVRIGAGLYPQEPDARQTPLDAYVLQKLPAHDAKLVQKAIDQQVSNLIYWLEFGTGLTEATHHLSN